MPQQKIGVINVKVLKCDHWDGRAYYSQPCKCDTRPRHKKSESCTFNIAWLKCKTFSLFFTSYTYVRTYETWKLLVFSSVQFHWDNNLLYQWDWYIYWSNSWVPSHSLNSYVTFALLVHECVWERARNLQH